MLKLFLKSPKLRQSTCRRQPNGTENQGTPTWRSWRAEAFPGERQIPVFHFRHDHAPGDLDVNLPHVSQQLLNAWERPASTKHGHGVRRGGRDTHGQHSALPREAQRQMQKTEGWAQGSSPKFFSWGEKNYRLTSRTHSRRSGSRCAGGTADKLYPCLRIHA